MLGFDFVNVDEAAHLVGSLELTSGGQLYRTFVDNKPPLIYLFYALAGGSMWALRLLAIVLLWLPLGWLASRCARAPRDRLLVGGLYLLTSAGFVAADTHAVNTELVGLVPTALAAWFFHRRRSFGALFVVGALVGVAGLAKQPYLAFLAAPGLALLWPWPGVLTAASKLAALGLGCLAVLGGASALFVLAGSHDEYLSWAWLFNLQHVSAPVSVAEALVRFAKMGLPLVGVSLGLWALAFWRKARASTPRPEERFVWAALVVTLLPAFLGFRLFGHYFLPAHYFLVQLAAPAFLRAWSEKGLLRAAAILAVLPGVVFTFLNPLLYAPGFGVAPVTDPVFREVGEYLKQRPCPGPIFVWGYAPQIYVFAERRPASRYVLPIEPITGFVSGNERFESGELPPDFHVSEARRAELLADLERTPPAYVVDLSRAKFDHWDRFPLRAFPALAALVEADYRSLEKPVGTTTSLRTMTILERRRCSEGAQ